MLFQSMNARFKFIIFFFVLLLHSFVCYDDGRRDYILCRKCGSDIADISYFENRFSPEALIQYNQTLFQTANVGVQLLRNLANVEFRVITLSKAACIGHGQWQTEHSWYPGYAWKHCLCAHCYRHLGWVFEPIDSARETRNVPSVRGFYVLILDNILSESFSNSLIAPVSYKL